MLWLVLFRREDSVPFKLHDCLENADSEIEYLRQVSETFINELLPSSYAANSFVRNLLREILACKGIYSVSIFYHREMLRLCSTMLED